MKNSLSFLFILSLITLKVAQANEAYDCFAVRCLPPQITECPTYYLSGQLGIGASKITTNLSLDPATTKQFGQTQLGMDGMQFGISGGFGKAFCLGYYFYAGVELGFFFDTEKNKKSWTDRSGTPTADTIYLDINRKNSFETSVMFGKFFASSLIFARFGGTSAKWHGKVAGSTLTSHGSEYIPFVNRYSRGVILGLGVRSNISCDSAISIEYQWHRYPAEGKLSNLPVNMKARTHNIRVGYSWLF